MEGIEGLARGRYRPVTIDGRTLTLPSLGQIVAGAKMSVDESARLRAIDANGPPSGLRLPVPCMDATQVSAPTGINGPTSTPRPITGSPSCAHSGELG